ncbi:MAG: thiamine pyrophosphate-dependent enzyme, partial [Terriglobales bacterium]
MLVVNERLARASSFEIVATPDPAVPHRVLDQFTSLNLAPSRFSVRRVNAQTASIHVAFESLDAERARRIASRLRRIVGVKGVELSLAIHPVAESAIRPALTTAPSHDLTARDGADLLLETLAAVGVDTIFGYPGGAALPIYDALFKQSRIRHILVRHEQAAAHAAEGYARSTGRVGVVGYGLPAAIGAQIAHPKALVIDIAGEASIQMNIQELATAVQYRLPVKVFIINNRYMGMVRQWQEMIHG